MASNHKFGLFVVGLAFALGGCLAAGVFACSGLDVERTVAGIGWSVGLFVLGTVGCSLPFPRRRSKADQGGSLRR